jgi:hypothetical protein
VNKGQMDLVVRYFDEKSRTCITQYLTSTFLGTSRAEDLLTHFCKALHDSPLNNILQISMDGPAVNWSFMAKFEEKQEMEGCVKKLVHLGSCGLQVVSGAFQIGH